MTIEGEPFPHLLFECVLSFSGWTYVALAASETFEALVAGKAFDNSAVMTHLHPAGNTGHFTAGAIRLKVNGDTKQRSDLKDMI